MLVVEDSDFFRQLVTPILGAAGYRVTAAPSAADALRLREAGAMFDVIVSDIAMPDMDGLDFARAVRAGGPWATLPLIALSARTEPSDVEAGRDAGFTDYVAKFQRDALIASLQAVPGRTGRGVTTRPREPAHRSEPQTLWTGMHMATDVMERPTQR